MHNIYYEMLCIKYCQCVTYSYSDCVCQYSGSDLCNCTCPFLCLQSGVLSPIRGGPQQLVVISLKEGVYKTVVGDPDDKKEVSASY